MNPAKKYRYYTAALLLAFLYLFATEVTGRWRDAIALYGEMSTRKEMSPEKLAMRKLELKTREQEIISALTQNSGKYEQSQTGVFEYLNASARSSGVKFETLIPTEGNSTGRLKESGFKIGINDDYHHIGKFINAIENGPMNARIQKIEMQRQAEASVNAIIEGSVTVFRR